MGPSDTELWERVRAGDSPAFAALFTRHARAVYNFCFRRTGSWSAAEDLSSLVFLHAWRVRDRIQLSRDSALPLLYGIAVNLTRNHHRTIRRQRAALDRLAPTVPAADGVPDADARLDAERRMESILARVSTLSDVDRDVLALCAWGGLTYAEAAGALGVPIGTVRSRLSRARSRLRELEDRDGHERSDARVSPPISEVTP